MKEMKETHIFLRFYQIHDNTSHPVRSDIFILRASLLEMEYLGKSSNVLSSLYNFQK